MSSLDVFPEEPHRELQASEEFFLSILPLGMKRSLDIDGWVLQLPPHSDAAAEMIHDFEVKTSALELLCSQHDKLRATFPDDFKYIGTPLPVLVLQVKNLSKFFSFDIIVEDTSGQTRTISASNKDNLIRFDALHARLPLRLVPGWNSVCARVGACRICSVSCLIPQHFPSIFHTVPLACC